MTERIAPPPDRYASCPHSGSVLEYYSGCFESAFVLLHPFIRPISIEASRFHPSTYPKKAELIATCTGVTWREVMSMAGFASIAEIDIALRTRIHGLRGEYADKQLAEKLDGFAEHVGLVPPGDGDIPELIENRFFEAVQHLEYRWLWVGDEFCSERKLWWIEDLKGIDVCGGHKNLFTPDCLILFTTHWDSHFSFVCSSRARLEALVSFGGFEGFYCEPETEVYWSLSGDRSTAV
jgi:uncharacterized protein DUF2711